MPNYRVEQQPDGRWYIVNASDETLAWASSHWFFRDEAGPPLTRFADREGAVNYARKVLGGEE